MCVICKGHSFQQTSVGEEYEVLLFSNCSTFFFPLFWSKLLGKFLCSWIFHMVAGKVEFSPNEDAHVIGDCIKVSS